MKKLLLSLSLSFLFAAANSQVANSSFETWNSLSYNNPDTWMSANKETISNGFSVVSRTNGVSGYAVRLQTVIANGDTAGAYITNGDPMSGEGGVPFSQQPTAITGFYKYNLPANDSAILLVIFKNNGNIISSDFFKIKGTGVQTYFTQFTLPLSLSSMPDSVIIAAASSNLIDNVGIENGSFIELDNLAFTGASMPIPNGTFESWTTTTLDLLPDWEAYGDGFSKTTDAYDGNFAVRLETIDYGGGNIGTAGITNGHESQNGTIGGIPYTLTDDTLTGYYKYITSYSDSASIGVSLMKNSNNISGGGQYLPATSQYTYFEIPIHSQMAPDTMRIDISSSKWPYNQQSAGSVLFVDHIALKSTLIAGIQESKKENNPSIVTYPNPTNNFLHVTLSEKVNGKVTTEIYDMNGRLVISENKSNEKEFNLNISNLKSGKYFCRIITNDSQKQISFTKE